MPRINQWMRLGKNTWQNKRTADLLTINKRPKWSKSRYKYKIYLGTGRFPKFRTRLISKNQRFKESLKDVRNFISFKRTKGKWRGMGIKDLGLKGY